MKKGGGIITNKQLIHEKFMLSDAYFPEPTLVKKEKKKKKDPRVTPTGAHVGIELGGNSETDICICIHGGAS